MTENTTAETEYEYGFYDADTGPDPIFWYLFGLPFESAGMAMRSARKSVYQSEVIVRRVKGQTEYEIVDHDAAWAEYMEMN